MNSFLMAIKREYWEHRSLVLGLPLLLAAFILISAIGVEVVAHKVAEHEVTQMLEDGLSDKNGSFQELRSELIDPFDFMSKFVGVGWLAGLFYLLSCLFNDRRDKSILFFKSLPFSERDNVLAKLAFATLVAPALAIVIGWMLAILLGLFSLGTRLSVSFSFSTLSDFIALPIQSVIVGLIWGAPIFAYIALASSTAKKHPFLMAVVPLLGLAVVESIILDQRPLSEFLLYHMPFKVLNAGDSGSAISITQAVLIEDFTQVLLGLVAAGLLISATIWVRNNRYEL